jgi:RNA polymerase sigma-70 factor (ECF subfamily)
MTGPTRSGADDAALVRAVADGSQSALAELYDRHGSAIFALALRLSGDRWTAEEVVQETFLVLWDRAERFDPTVASLTTWLRTIARNRALDRLRAAARRPRLVSLEPDPDMGGGRPDPEAFGELVAAGSVAADPVDHAAAGEQRAAIAAAVATMPDDERMVILLAYQQDLTQVEIAERLGWPLGTVKTRTRRGLRRLRAALGDADSETAAATDGPDPETGTL